MDHGMKVVAQWVGSNGRVVKRQTGRQTDGWRPNGPDYCLPIVGICGSLKVIAE